MEEKSIKLEYEEDQGLKIKEEPLFFTQEDPQEIKINEEVEDADEIGLESAVDLQKVNVKENIFVRAFEGPSNGSRDLINVPSALVQTPASLSKSSPSNGTPQFINARHLPLPYIGKSGKKEQKRCRQCSKRKGINNKAFKKLVTTFCPGCPGQPGLCLECVAPYHAESGFIVM